MQKTKRKKNEKLQKTNKKETSAKRHQPKPLRTKEHLIKQSNLEKWMGLDDDQ